MFGGGRIGTIDDFRRARVSGSGAGRAARPPARASGQGARRRDGRVRARRRRRVPRRRCRVESAVNTTRATFAIVRSLESGGSGARAVIDTSILAQAVPPSRVRRRMARIEHLARVLQVYARPASGPLSFWYETPEINEAASPDARQYFMRFRGKADYARPVRCRRRPAARLSRPTSDGSTTRSPSRSTAWRDSTAGATAATPAIATAWLAASRWLAVEPAAQRPRRAGVAPPLRLALPAAARGAVVLGLAQGNGVSMLVRAATRPATTAFAEAAHRAFQSLELPVSRRRRARDRRARSRLDRGVPRRSAEPHPERVHLGALGRLRLRALEPARRRSGALGARVSARSPRAGRLRYRLVVAVRGADTTGAGCWQASTITGFTPCSFRCSTS